jgi:hypothetical protein
MSGIYGYPTDPAQTTGTVGTSAGEAGTIITEDNVAVKALNNAMRGIAGDLGNFRNDIAAANTSTGTGTAYVLATDSQISALADGLVLSWLPNVTNTGAATLNVDTLGAKKLLASGAALVAGNIVAGQPVIVTYDASADSAAGAWLVANPVPVSGSVSYTSDDIGNDSGVTGVTVTAALDQLDTDKANLASPTFTGTPAAPTASPGTNTTQLATTAFVVASYAPLASPALTGNPTAPTQSASDNSTKIATTAYVDAATAGAGGGAWEFIATADASGDSSIAFTGFDASKYDAYALVLSNVTPSINANIGLRTSTNGGSSYDSGASDYAVAAMSYNTNSGTANVNDPDTDRINILPVNISGAAASMGASGIIYIFGAHLARKTSIYAMISAQQVFDYYIVNQLMGTRLSEADVDAVQFIPSAGNIASGTITFYGIKNA